jgi:hypothetical protein
MDFSFRDHMPQIGQYHFFSGGGACVVSVLARPLTAGAAWGSTCDSENMIDSISYNVTEEENH